MPCHTMAMQHRSRARPLFVALPEDVRAALDAIVADAGALARRRVTIVEVVTQLVLDVAERGKPLRIR